MGVERKWLHLITGFLLILTTDGRHFCVTPTTTSSSSLKSCDTSQCSENHTLEEYSTKTKTAINSNSQLFFLSGNHSLNTTLLIQNKTNLSLIGCNERVIISCQHDAGVKFENVSKLVIKNVQFIRCRATITDFEFKHHASLVILEGWCLNLINVTITEGVGAGIFIRNVRGLTNILNLTVTGTNQTGNEIAYLNSSDDKNYQLILRDSRFTENVFNSECEVSGLTVRVTQCYATIEISGSKFTGNCGNLAFIFTNITNISAMQVRLSHSVIERGRALKGGGLYVFITKYVSKLSNSIYRSQDLYQNSLSSATIIENVTFSSNVAYVLGAAFYLQLKASTQVVMVYHNITLINCTFFNNSLSKPNTGGGIAIHSNFYDYLFQFNPQYKILLRDCHFHNHFILSPNRENTSGNSVVFINTNDYFEFHNVNISNNSVNAVTAVDSNLIFRGRVILSHNNGSSGGGLHLCQNTIMYLAPNTTIDIFNNTVKHVGGGIHVEPHSMEIMPKCFFQVNSYEPVLVNTTHINIYNNTAAYDGSNLFGGDVDFCYMIDRPDWNISPFNSSQAYHTIFHIISHDNFSVASTPRQVCFCTKYRLDCDNLTKTIKFNYPGESIIIKAALVGQVMGTVRGVVQTWSTDGIEFDGKVQMIDHECSNLIYTFFSNKTSNCFNFSVGIQQSGDHSSYERLWPYTNKYLEVYLKECPIGFALNPTSDNKINYTCANCFLQYQDLKCNFKKKVKKHRIDITRKALGTTWIGFEYDDSNKAMPSSIQHNINCPFDYCIQQEVTLRMMNIHYNSSQICDNNRDGIACGRCQEGYSALLGSSKCAKCTNYYLVLIVAFAIAGFALVAVLTFLNLTISEGTLSGLIFYANVVEYNISFVLPHGKSDTFPTPILRVFVAWINLDLGIPTCFYNGMDAYAESWLEFAFPLYIWGIAIAIILLSNRFQIVATIASRNAVKVLATLILLSYTKFSRAAINAFSYTEIHSLLRNHSNGTTVTAWLIDANLMYFEFKHALLVAVALLCGVVCLPFTITLLFIKPMQRFSHKKPFRWLDKLKPFLDAFTGPYTDNGRFWPGLLLLARICLLVTGGFSTLSSEKVVQSVTSLVIIILLGFAIVVRPGLYRSQILDALEYSFLLNLAVLLLGTIYYDGVYSHQKAVFDTTVGLAFFIFVLIIVYHLWLKIRRYDCTLRFVVWLREKKENLSNTIRAANNGAIQPMNDLPPSSIEFNQEREPLLAD